VVAAWEAVAGPYHAYWGPRFRPFLAEALAAFAPGPGPLAVPGCGPGDEALALADRHPDREVWATDPAPAMRVALRRRLAAAPRRNVRVAPGAAVDLADVVAGAGGVFSSFTLQLLPDRAAALAAWARALGPGGAVAVVFWPRQPDAHAWGRLGRAIARVTGLERPDWEAPLREALPGRGLALVESRDLVHEIAHASPEEAWASLRDACSMQVLHRRLGEERAEACGRAWLEDPGLERRGDVWVHRETARLWLLRRR